MSPEERERAYSKNRTFQKEETMKVTETLIELERLAKEATVGPWREERRPQYGYTVWGPCGRTGSMQVAGCGHAGFDANNAALIVALRNDCDALIAIAKAGKLVTEWAADAKQEHAPWCDYGNEERTECCCGMDQLRAAIARLTP